MNGNEREADGQEYQRTLESQGEAEVYLQLYAALLADRREALLHERTLLALHDIREKKLRQTAAAMKAATVLEELTSSKNHGPEISNVVLQPEDEITRTELSARRKAILQELGDKALRTVCIFNWSCMIRFRTHLRLQITCMVLLPRLGRIQKRLGLKTQLID